MLSTTGLFGISIRGTTAVAFDTAIGIGDTAAVTISISLRLPLGAWPRRYRTRSSPSL